MGTHPIFESDFDCLTDKIRKCCLNQPSGGAMKSCLLVFGIPGMAQVISDVSEGVCKLSHNHKPFPSAEPNLNGECRQWRNNSCCSSDTSKKIHNLHGKSSFNHQHCGRLSDQCLVKMFRQWCLYQCDPYLDQWIVNYTEPEDTTFSDSDSYSSHNSSSEESDSGVLGDLDLAQIQEITNYYREHSHRLNLVPLCQSDCDTWWTACKKELTCTNNWYKGFTWEQGYDGQWHNLCKDESPEACKPIDNWFDNSRDFCEGIFPGDYRVVSDADVCISFMKPEFNYNASKGTNSTKVEEEWIGGAIAAVVCSVSLLGLAYLLWKRRKGRAEIDDLTTSLATADELSREVAA